MVGHIVPVGSKRPDPERLRALKAHPVPGNYKALRRLIVSFAYNAKWVAQYSSRIQPLLEAQKQGVFSLISNVIFRINDIKSQTADACLNFPQIDAVVFLLENDDSGYAIGSSLSQNSRPMEHFLQILLQCEKHHSAARKEDLNIIEHFRKVSILVRTLLVIVKTDQKNIAFIFCSKINNKEG